MRAILLARPGPGWSAVRPSSGVTTHACAKLDELACGFTTARSSASIANTLKQLLGDVAHQGVAADITPLPPWTEDELFEALQSATNPVVLALDGVQDPHNLGACLRTADACGALAVIVPLDRAARVNATVREGRGRRGRKRRRSRCVTNLVRTWKLPEAKPAFVGRRRGCRLARGRRHEGRPYRWDCACARRGSGQGCGTSPARPVTGWCACRSWGPWRASTSPSRRECFYMKRCASGLPGRQAALAK